MTLQQAMQRWNISNVDLSRVTKETIHDLKEELLHKIANDKSMGQILSKGWKQDIEALDVLLEVAHGGEEG